MTKFTALFLLAFATSCAADRGVVATKSDEVRARVAAIEVHDGELIATLHGVFLGTAAQRTVRVVAHDAEGAVLADEVVVAQLAHARGSGPGLDRARCRLVFNGAERTASVAISAAR